MHKTILVIGPAYSGKTSIARSLCSPSSMSDTTLLYFAPRTPTTSDHTSLDWHWQDLVDADLSKMNHEKLRLPASQIKGMLCSDDPNSFLNLISHNLNSQVLILDGLNLWWAQLYLKNLGKYAPEHAYRTTLEEAQSLFHPLSEFGGNTLIMVTQEMGLGLPPRAASERYFRQGMGLWNQHLCQYCSETFWVVAGKILARSQ